MNLIQIAHKTMVADRKHYNKSSRTRTIGSLLRWLWPNLNSSLFILGAPRSGTTFLGKCIGVLPEFSYHFEPVSTKLAARYIYERHWSMPKARFFYRQVYACLMRLHFDGDLRFAEKTPRNCFLIDFLSDTFPDSQFIHIIRDGRDAALSYSKKPWLQASHANSKLKEPGGYSYGPYARFWVEHERIREFESTSDIHRCIWAWRRFTESALKSAAKLSSNRYFELRYEDLVSSPRSISEQLLNFLKITDLQSRTQFKAALLEANPNLAGQWQHELTEDQIQQIQSEAGELLTQLNYKF